MATKNSTASKQLTAWATIAEAKHKMESAATSEMARLDQERAERERRRSERVWWMQH
jgi:hypothetical protein